MVMRVVLLLDPLKKLDRSSSQGRKGGIIIHHVSCSRNSRGILRRLNRILEDALGSDRSGLTDTGLVIGNLVLVVWLVRDGECSSRHADRSGCWRVHHSRGLSPPRHGIPVILDLIHTSTVQQPGDFGPFVPKFLSGMKEDVLLFFRPWLLPQIRTQMIHVPFSAPFTNPFGKVLGDLGPSPPINSDETHKLSVLFRRP